MIVRDLCRYKQRIKSFLYFYGIEFPPEFELRSSHWSLKFLNWLDSIPMFDEPGRMALIVLTREVRQQRTLLLDTTKKIHTLALSPKYADRVKLLVSIPGIGIITAISILTEVETMERFNGPDKFAAYVGLIPMSHSSGDKTNIGDITFRAHDFLRKSLIESAWIAIRRDPALLLAYQSFVKRMEPNNAIVRIAHKLANRIYAVLKCNRKYEINVC